MYTKNDYETIGKAIRYMIKEVPEKINTIKDLVLELKTIYKRKHNFVEILHQIIVEYKIQYNYDKYIEDIIYYTPH